jgi:undecaprenyl diphosphate synthase
VRWCFDAEVKYLTLYLFSTENWNRAEEELAKLLGPVAQAAIEKKFPILMELGAKVNIFGSTDRFAKPIGEALRKLEQDSAANNNIVVNFCVDYGGRTELVNAVREIVKENPAQVDEATIEKHLYSAGIPDPDLMIRTGGAHRVSNFLLWQQAYTEFYFVDKYLPDFTQEDFKEALRWYAEEERRFGK